MFAIIRAKKHNSFATVARSARHTFREQFTPNSSAARAGENRFAGSKSTRALVAAIKERLPLSRRRDAVICIEYLIAASPEAFARHGGHLDDMGSGYFSDALSWLRKRHGSANVVCGAVHLDETTPHMAVYVVPLTKDGRLSARDFLGGPKIMRDLQDSFYSECGMKHGLTRGIKGSKSHHTTIASFYTCLQAKEHPPTLTAKDYAAKAAGIETDAWKEVQDTVLSNSRKLEISLKDRKSHAARAKAIGIAEQRIDDALVAIMDRERELEKREVNLKTQEYDFAKRQPLVDLLIAEAQAFKKEAGVYRHIREQSKDYFPAKKPGRTPEPPHPR